MNKDEVFTKALNILAKKEQEKKHVHVCVRANICPECGEELKSLDYEERRKLSENKYISDEQLICSKDITHYNKKIYYPDDED